MTRPSCGKCHSKSVYLTWDFQGNKLIACLKCGNRYPGGVYGFYMTNKTSGAIQNTTKDKEKTMEEKQIQPKETRLCSICEEKPTISDSSPYCASCMARKGNEKRKLDATRDAGIDTAKKTKEYLHPCQKKQQRGNNEVVVDFADYQDIHAKLKALAKDQIRPVDAQIIFIIKKHFDACSIIARTDNMN